MDQEWPRKCLNCGAREPARGGANAIVNLDDVMDASPKGPEEPTLLLGAEEAYVFTEYRNATIALRDAELELRAQQERYRKALEALNNSIAKVGA